MNTELGTVSPLVLLSGISKSFDGKIVIDDLNLSINNGEFLTLLGPSGCGKTTVLRLIAGLESVDNGQIHLEDQDITIGVVQDSCETALNSSTDVLFTAAAELGERRQS